MSRAELRYERRETAVEAIAIRGEPVGLVARVMQVPMRTLFGWLARYRRGAGMGYARASARADRAK